MTAPITHTYRTLRKRFGQWLKHRREEIGLTQLDLALRLDYGYPTTVSQIERGLASLPAHDARTWAEMLRVPPEEFARKYLYHLDPFVYQLLYGESPFDLEQLPVPDSPVMKTSKARGGQAPCSPSQATT